jgi:hypothetical protein
MKHQWRECPTFVRIGWLDTKAAFDLPEGTELFTRPTPAAARVPAERAIAAIVA